MTFRIMKYFSEYIETSPFNNQKDLADKLDSMQELKVIQSDFINPLTARLFMVKEAIIKLQNLQNKIKPVDFPYKNSGFYNGSDERSGIFTPIVRPSGCFESYSACHTDLNDWSTDPLTVGIINSYSIIKNPEDGNDIIIIDNNSKIHSFDIYSNIFYFFISAYSVLDRIRLELNTIYFDGEIKLEGSNGNGHWKKYTNEDNDKVNILRDNGFNDLVSIITDASSKSITKNISRYRNPLVHDGILEFKINGPGNKFYLHNHPRAPNRSFTVELIPFAEEIFSDIQKLLYNIYNQITKDLESKTDIPLIEV